MYKTDLMLTVLFRLLTFTEDESKIRSQDFFTTVKYLSRNPVAGPHVWTWVRVKWPRLVDRCVHNSVISHPNIPCSY